MSDIRRTTMKGEFLMLAHTPGPAKQLEGVLRSAGHMVRVLATPGIDSFRDVLAKSEIEIVIFHHDFKDCDLLQAVEISQRTDPDVPVLLLNNRIDAAIAASASTKGASGVICLEDSQFVEATCVREYTQHQLRREVRELRARLEELERERAAAADQSQRPILTVQEGIVVTANAALAVALHADDPDELIGMPLMDLVTAPYQAAMKSAIKDGLKGKASEQAQPFALQFPGQEPYALVADITPVDVEGQPAIEISGATRGRAASADSSATGLRRSSLLDTLAEIRTLGGDGTPLLALARIDDYNHLDATYGFIGGDEIRHQVVDRIREQLGRQSNVIPFCDGTLAWLGQSPSLEQAREDLSKIQQHVARSVFTHNDQDASVTLSAVLHPFDVESEDVETALNDCVAELDTLCASGKNGLAICGGRKAESAQDDQLAQSWRERVSAALEQNRLQLSFQSIASLGNDERQLTDVLVRLLDDSDRSYPAREFIGFIEGTPIIASLDRWVIEQAVMTIQKLVKSGKQPALFVRVSGMSLKAADDFIPWLQKLLTDHPIPASTLVLMLREDDLQQQIKRGLLLVSKAKGLGADVAIDHFGVLPQSVELMKRVKTDYVKLHADFTSEIIRPNAEMKALNVIMDAAEERGIRTVAEQVGDANAMARLWQLGVNYLMGAHVHSPETELRDVSFQLH